MNTSRTYQDKDVDMLTACATIVENAIARQQFLSVKRSNWTSDFFEQLKNRIDNAFVNYLGISSATELRNATQAVNQIQEEAMSDLTEIKTQIDADYQKDKKRRDEILKQLGYTDFFKKSRSRDQEALIQLLFTYNKKLATITV